MEMSEVDVLFQGLVAAVTEADAARRGSDLEVERLASDRLKKTLSERLLDDLPEVREALIYAADRVDVGVLREMLEGAAREGSVSAIDVGVNALPQDQATEFVARLDLGPNITMGQSSALAAVYGYPDLREEIIAHDLPELPLSKLPSITTIVHGTWAASKSWWRPGGEFARYINRLVPDLYAFSDFFTWSGRNDDNDRREAARKLKHWVEDRLEPSGELTLICHSHGGNMAMLSTRMGLRVAKLTLLGTPIRTDYTMAVQNIGLLANAYVPWDLAQSPLGMGTSVRREGRTLPDSDGITNNPVMDGAGGIRAAHTDLHTQKVWERPENNLQQHLQPVHRGN